MFVSLLYATLVSVLTSPYSQVHAFEPNFIQDLKNVTVPKGKDAVFTCVVQNLGGYKVAWLNADTKAILAIHDHVITNNHRLVAAHTDPNTWTLTIRTVKREDRGAYMCQVNTDPMKSTKVFLEVVVPPDIVSTGTSTDTTVVENKSATLECKARGVPKPSITWKREDGGEIIMRNANNEKNKTFVYEGESLHLPKVTRYEMGTYLCIASNGVPPAVSQRVQLTVNFHPLIHVPNQLVGVPLGKTATLHCISEAYPKPINYWEREDKPENQMVVHDRKKYEINENVTNEYTFHLTLHLRKLKPRDYGTYKCISKNSIGDSEGTIRIYEIDPTTITQQAKPFDNEISNIATDIQDNETYDDTVPDDEDEDDSSSFRNKTKKLIRYDNSNSARRTKYDLDFYFDLLVLNVSLLYYTLRWR